MRKIKITTKKVSTSLFSLNLSFKVFRCHHKSLEKLRWWGRVFLLFCWESEVAFSPPFSSFLLTFLTLGIFLIYFLFFSLYFTFLIVQKFLYKILINLNFLLCENVNFPHKKKSKTSQKNPLKKIIQKIKKKFNNKSSKYQKNKKRVEENTTIIFLIPIFLLFPPHARERERKKENLSSHFHHLIKNSKIMKRKQFFRSLSFRILIIMRREREGRERERKIAYKE